MIQWKVIFTGRIYLCKDKINHVSTTNIRTYGATVVVVGGFNSMVDYQGSKFFVAYSTVEVMGIVIVLVMVEVLRFFVLLIPPWPAQAVQSLDACPRSPCRQYSSSQEAGGIAYYHGHHETMNLPGHNLYSFRCMPLASYPLTDI